jgi:hypothetical protein
VVAARATKSANQNIATTAATTVTWNTYTIDTHGGFSGNTYTIPVSGFYRVSLTIDAFNITAGASGYFNSIITKNGSSLQGQYFYVASSGDQIATNTGIFQFVAGDQITATVASPDGNYTIRANDCFISIERLSGPSAIAASETVAASYHLSSNQSVSTTVRYNFDAKIFDTHNAVTTGASWVFTAPISGKYEIWINSYASSSSYNNYIYKNGSQFQYINDGINGKSASGNVMIDLIAGDTVHARPNTSITAQGGNLITGYTIIGIKRIGN